MALGSNVVWGKLKGFIWHIMPEKVRIQRIKIGGTGQAFTTYATGGIEYDVCGAYEFTEADTSVILDATTAYRFAYDKSNNKIFFLVQATGAELSNGTDVSGIEVYGTLLGK